MTAKAIAQPQYGAGDEQMSWRAAAALWAGLATLGWISLASLVSALL